jgi:hypothetical protein
MKPKVVNQVTLLRGGATSPTVVLYQLASGRCRLYWYAFDQDGLESQTIAVFKCKDWRRAVEIGVETVSTLIAAAKRNANNRRRR